MTNSQKDHYLFSDLKTPEGGYRTVASLTEGEAKDFCCRLLFRLADVISHRDNCLSRLNSADLLHYGELEDAPR